MKSARPLYLAVRRGGTFLVGSVQLVSAKSRADDFSKRSRAMQMEPREMRGEPARLPLAPHRLVLTSGHPVLASITFQ
jgi:hypothetical protein